MRKRNDRRAAARLGWIFAVAAAAAGGVPAEAGAPPAADMSCAALRTEMESLAERQGAATAAIQAATGQVMAAQARQLEAARRARHTGAASGAMLAVGSQLASLLPGGGVAAALIGSAAAPLLGSGARAAPPQPELEEARRQGEAAAATVIAQQGAALRMNEVMTALTAKAC